MLKKILSPLAALCLLAFSLGTALAHEPRDIEDYNLVVGFLHEPAFEGMLNGVSLRVTKVAAHGHGEEASTAMSTTSADKKEGSSSDGHSSMGHGSMESGEAGHDHGPMESEVPVSVKLMTEVEDGGGVNVHIMTEGWRWAPEDVNLEHKPGEGHAHIYVDGVKVSRVYSPYHHLKGLEAGERHVRVTLNANTHNDLTVDGEAVEAMAMVTIPESSHHDMTQSAHHQELIDAPSAMSLEIIAHPDAMSGYNLHVMPLGFTFAPRSVNGDHVPGEGYGIVSIDGEDYTRLYTEWLSLPALDAGMHTVEVKLVSNDHMSYSWRGEPVQASATVHVEEDGDHDGEEPEDSHAHGEELTVGVEGLEHTLQVEVTHVPSGVKRLMTLTAIFDEPGYYKADFIPTASGQYTFHFTGAIEGMRIDEVFESGVGRFDDVQPATAIQFPESAASSREMEAALRGVLEGVQVAQDTALGVQSAADSAQNSASTATTLAMVGIVVGAVGIMVGCVGMFAAFRRKD